MTPSAPGRATDRSPATFTLSEAESKLVLARAGIPVIPERTAADPDAAAAAATELGFPVVVKLCGRAIAHKTERGLVRLGVGDATAVRAAAHELLGRATAADGSVEVLVAPMVRGSRELIAGLVDDAQFGRCVMLGVGGVLAEAVRDVAFRLAPIDEVDADEMLDDLATQALLGPFRGEPAIDREALRAVVLGLSHLAVSEPRIAAVDVNPLIVTDGRPVAVDALVEVTEELT
ncbi:MAG TPA: acetate--CoA ligase family protein [Acidimicrobiia bacterium]|nr:acetate--CoA ligase family protein [Acidimicrobiia bacterium]